MRLPYPRIGYSIQLADLREEVPALFEDGLAGGGAGQRAGFRVVVCGQCFARGRGEDAGAMGANFYQAYNRRYWRASATINLCGEQLPQYGIIELTGRFANGSD